MLKQMRKVVWCVTVKVVNSKFQSHLLLSPVSMAVSQSLTSIMEEMVTKVMEDAVSTSIIFTQVPVQEVHKIEKYTRRNFVENIVSIFSFFTCDRSPTRVTRKVTKSSLLVVHQRLPTSSTLTT